MMRAAQGQYLLATVEASFYVLVAGILLGLYEQAFGVRQNQAGRGTFSERFAFAWSERRCTILGSVLVLISAVLAAFGY